MCHDLDLRSYLKGQGHSAHLLDIRVRASLPSWILIIFHTIVVHDQRVCHDLDPRSYLRIQGHSAHIPKIRVRAITPPCQVESEKYFTQLLSMTQGCVMALTPDHISKVKVTVHIYRESVSGGLYSSLPSWNWIIFYTIVVHDPRVCHDLAPRSYLRGHGHSAHIPRTVSGP